MTRRRQGGPEKSWIHMESQTNASIYNTLMPQIYMRSTKNPNRKMKKEQRENSPQNQKQMSNKYFKRFPNSGVVRKHQCQQQSRSLAGTEKSNGTSPPVLERVRRARHWSPCPAASVTSGARWGPGHTWVSYSSSPLCTQLCISQRNPFLLLCFIPTSLGIHSGRSLNITSCLGKYAWDALLKAAWNARKGNTRK